MFIYHDVTWSNNILCLSPAGAVPAAARGGRVGHQSPLSFTTFCSPLITVNYNGGTAHFSGASLLLRLNANSSQVVPSAALAGHSITHQASLSSLPEHLEWVKNSVCTFLPGEIKKPLNSIYYKYRILHLAALCHVPEGLSGW